MTDSSNHNDLSKSILKTLLYFDIFQYPLTAEEVFTYLQTNHVNWVHVREKLIEMGQASTIYTLDQFYSIHNNSALEIRRKKGNLFAIQCLEMARKKARLIASFPFVQAVMASGSLSKGYMDQDSDLDFFIITRPKRLWIARTLLVLYKRIFLFNSHKHFCINYFVDEDHLEIEEKNIFTATELATVIPLFGAEHYKQLMAANQWSFKFLPNHQERTTQPIPNLPIDGFKRFTEGLINFMGADVLEKFFMGLTLNRWKRLYQHHYPPSDFEVAFKTKSYVSKNHPRHFQRKVMERYQNKLDEFESKFSIQWHE